VQAKNLSTMIVFSSWEKESLALVVDLLQQAIARDPGFFLAYYELAYIHDKAYVVGVDHTPARLALAEHAVEAARRLRRTRERRIWPMLTISTVPTSIMIARAPSLFLRVSSCQMTRLFSNCMVISTAGKVAGKIRPGISNAASNSIRALSTSFSSFRSITITFVAMPTESSA
jgi:hypothetical protein